MINDVVKDYCFAIKTKTSQGDYIGAIAIADRLVYAYPNSEKGYYYRGICYFGMQRYEESVVNYKMAVKINPLDAKAYFNLGTAYQQLQQYDLALINIGKALILFSRQGKEDAKQKCFSALSIIERERC